MIKKYRTYRKCLKGKHVPQVVSKTREKYSAKGEKRARSISEANDTTQMTKTTEETLKPSKEEVPQADPPEKAQLFVSRIEITKRKKLDSIIEKVSNRK